MAKQIQPSVTTPTIAELYGKISDNKLELAPDFQRRFVWTQEHQEEFIDTILNGLPFPEIYVCRGETNVNKIQTTQKVIDGQQRLTTILNYIDNNFENPLKLVPAYSNLDDQTREDFLEYQVVIRDLGKVDDQIIKEIFRRINLTKFKLEDIEIQNAIYDGQFIQTAKDLSEKIKLEKYEVFQESEFTRMIDVHFFLLILSTLERDGYFTRDIEIEKCIVAFNEKYENQNERKSQIYKAFSELDKLELPIDSIWFRKSNFFTLVIELSKNNLNLNNLKDKLLRFEEEVIANKQNKENIFGEYYSYMYTGTNNRKSRIKRSEILQNFVNS